MSRTPLSARLVPDEKRPKYIAVNLFREVRRGDVKAIAYFMCNGADDEEAQ